MVWESNGFWINPHRIGYNEHIADNFRIRFGEVQKVFRIHCMNQIALLDWNTHTHTHTITKNMILSMPMNYLPERQVFGPLAHDYLFASLSLSLIVSETH